MTGLTCEYLPALGAARQELVLLHGWGTNREIWRPLLAALRPWANVSLVDIPGLAPGCGDKPPELAELLTAILKATPDRAVYLGWSLGGQLALELAASHPDRVVALAALCCNPCFPAREGWPGMAPDQLAGFGAALERDAARTLRRFDSLQLAGASSPRPLMRFLNSLRAGASGLALRAGLEWLAELDQRALCRDLPVPQLHLLGELDGLLPRELGVAMQALLAHAPQAETETLPACSHIAPLEAGESIATSLRAFLQRMDLLLAAEATPQKLAKVDVADSFSRAAGQYDSVAQLQRDVGKRLLTKLDHLSGNPQRVLDLGSGTGYFAPELQRRFPGAAYTGLDLAEGMVRYSRERIPDQASWLVADAEALPLAAESVDLVFSSLAVQWCYNPQLLFAELARILKPGGACVFTSLGPDTLKELRASWAAVDDYQHVNSFLPASALEKASNAIPGVELALEVSPFRMEYGQVRQLLNELKTLGAHNVNRDRPAGLTGRRSLQGMLRAYESWRVDGLLPATYEVYFGVLQKL